MARENVRFKLIASGVQFPRSIGLSLDEEVVVDNRSCAREGEWLAGVDARELCGLVVGWNANAVEREVLIVGEGDGRSFERDRYAWCWDGVEVEVSVQVNSGQFHIMSVFPFTNAILFSITAFA